MNKKMLELADANELVTKSDLQLVKSELKGDLQILRKEFKGEIQKLGETVSHHGEMIEFMRENMVTRDEFYREMHRAFVEFKNEIIGHMDGLLVHHKTMELEHYALRASHERLQTTVHEHIARHP